MADPTLRFIQLQGFATIEYHDEALEIKLLNEAGYPITSGTGLVLKYDKLRDKQVFKVNVSGKQVEFINVLIEYNEAIFTTLKQLTNSNNVNWLTTDRGGLLSMATSKDPINRPPTKVMESNGLRDVLMDEDYNLISVDRVA